MNDPYTYEQLRLDDSMLWRWRFTFRLREAGYDTSWSEHYDSINIIPVGSGPNTVPYTFILSVDRIQELLFSRREFLKFSTELSNYFTEQAVDSLP